MHKNILKLQNHIKNRKSRNSNHFITRVTCGIPYLKYLYIYTYRHARYAICIYTWHTGMHQTRHGNYCSHACGLRDRTSKHGNHDCGIRHVLARSSVRGSRSPVGGVVKVYEPVFSVSTIPTTYQAHSIRQNQRRNSHVKRRKGWSADSSTSPSYTMVLFVTLFSFSFFLL